MREAGGNEFALESSPGVARLSAEMSSRKLLALDFIKRYYASWGHSPTLGEISAALHVSRKRAHGLVHELAAEKMVEIVAGKARGIRLPDRAEELSEADILHMLSERGWTIADGSRIVEPVTTSGLPLLPILDHAYEEALGPAPHTNPAGPSEDQDLGSTRGTNQRD